MLEDKLEDWSYKKAIFRYGMPCVKDRVSLGTVSLEEYNELLSYLGRENEIPDDLILKHFKLVVDSVDGADGEAVDSYFMGEHNHKIHKKEGDYSFYPEAFCKLCVSRDAVVLRKLDGDKYVVEYSNERSAVSGEYLGFDIKKGKEVRIHRGHIVRKL